MQFVVSRSVKAAAHVDIVVGISGVIAVGRSAKAQEQFYLFSIEEVQCIKLNDGHQQGASSQTDEPYVMIYPGNQRQAIPYRLGRCKAGQTLKPPVLLRSNYPGVRYEIWDRDGDDVYSRANDLAGTGVITMLPSDPDVVERSLRMSSWVNRPGDYLVRVSLTRVTNCPKKEK